MSAIKTSSMQVVDDVKNNCSCTLIHHGSAAAVSGNQIVTWINQIKNVDAAIESSSSSQQSLESTLVYASNALLNITDTKFISNPTSIANNTTAPAIVRYVHQTLRCSVLEKAPTVSVSPIVITCVVSAKRSISGIQATLVSAFSNGMIQIWLYPEHSKRWMEYTIPSTIDSTSGCRSITTLDAIWISSNNTLQIAVGTSSGMTWYEYKSEQESHESSIGNRIILEENVTTKLSTKTCGAVASIQFTIISLAQQSTSSIIILFVGTAAPRHNKIHVYQCDCSTNDMTTTTSIEYCGSLTGHEDWVTTLSCWTNDMKSFLLASGSQDARIRIWNFRTSTSTTSSNKDFNENETKSTTTVDTIMTDSNIVSDPEHVGIDEVLGDIDDANDEFLDEAGESRLEILHTNLNNTKHDSGITTVTLEALLCGHEEGVTSVMWHPNPMGMYGIDRLLISSSTDRTILLWSETPSYGTTTSTNNGGIWTPLSRVGSAGGILGGSIGSTLLGFCSISVEPIHGQTLVGHAYGGALHIWDAQNTAEQVTSNATSVLWKASPCITGHFNGITDCCWEMTNGDYLLTVSNDQTCRLWAPIHVSSSNQNIWLELARPQVHGYNLSAVASLSAPNHPHLTVTGADEKEIRVFDATIGTLRLLEAFSGNLASTDIDKPIHRVERAYIPSLGLSNKASPADAAAEDDENDESSPALATDFRLPLERDLGAVSVWPEVQKLFGHNTEIYCLASTIIPFKNDFALLASSSKARDAEDAKIRLWNVPTGQCIQVLSGGHRSTVATLSFSMSGKYLASSGKDRRLCIWKLNDSMNNNNSDNVPIYDLAWALDSAHKRIIWSVHFCPYESQILASGSRDGCIKIWSIHDNPSDNTTNVAEVVNFAPSFQRNSKPDSVTALAFAHIPCSSNVQVNNEIIVNAVIALGLESGRIELWCIPLTKNETTLHSNATPYPMTGIDPSMCHCDTITKLMWRPISSGHTSRHSNTNEDTNDATPTTQQYLASVSMDHGCRIFEIEFPSIEM